MVGVVATGAVHVHGLGCSDLEQLPFWLCLKLLERRRLLQFAPH